MRRLHGVSRVSAITALLVGALAGACFSATIYVNGARPDDSGNGLSWGAAKKTVQAGINAASPGDEVWVAAGTYVGLITLNSGIALLGAFPVNGGPETARSTTANETAITRAVLLP